MILEFVAMLPLIAGWLGCFWLARELSATGRIDSDCRLLRDRICPSEGFR